MKRAVEEVGLFSTVGLLQVAESQTKVDQVVKSARIEHPESSQNLVLHNSVNQKEDPGQVNTVTWSKFIRSLKGLDPGSHLAQEILQKIAPDCQRFSPPTVELDGNVLICGEEKLDASSARLVLKLFQAFLGHPTGQPTRNDLVQDVYGIDDLFSISRRRRSSYHHSVIKLISRARKLVQRGFCSEELIDYRWFVYDGITETWAFLCRKNSVIQT